MTQQTQGGVDNVLVCFFAEEDVTVVVAFLGDVGSLEAVL
jgi:hypothetical protein